MRWLLILSAISAGAWGQTPEPESSSQMHVQFVLGQHAVTDLDRKDGRMDQPVEQYVQEISSRISSQPQTVEVRVTRSPDVYA